MSVPPRGPEQARPDQPAGPSRPGGPVPPAPGGQQPPQQQPPQRPDEGHETARRRSANRIIDTSSGRDDGLNKCPRCGSAEIQYSLTANAPVCAYCRHSWNEENAERAFGLDSAIAELRGHTMASGTQDVRDDLSTVTLKCQGCGAEVVINVDQELQARCHWCRQTLSISSQIPNGAVPDAVLPFQLTREEAIERIDRFTQKRRAFAQRRFKQEYGPARPPRCHCSRQTLPTSAQTPNGAVPDAVLPFQLTREEAIERIDRFTQKRRAFPHSRFKQEYVPENVMGVYIPYLVVDGNMHAVLQGTGEVTTRQYTVTHGSGDNKRTETYYDADVYGVQRAFDMLVDDLTVESAERFNARDNEQATNNILNAVQPYDTENAVIYNSNYLKNFTSERSDLNVRDVDDDVEDKFLAIARAKAVPTINRYDRGVRWEREGVAVRGTRWVAVY